MSKTQAERVPEDEAQSVERRYRPSVDDDIPASRHADRNVNRQHIEDRCREFHILEHSIATSREEQKRELSLKIVQEREMQRPASTKPRQHRIHPDVTAFVVEGILRSGSDAFKSAFETFARPAQLHILTYRNFPATFSQLPTSSARFDALANPLSSTLTNGLYTDS